MAKSQGVYLALAALVLCSCSSAAGGDPARGKELFAKNCAICHGAAGIGAEAPALRGESARKNTAQLQAWIEKPAPPMPALYPNPLSRRDVADVAAFVETLK